MTMRDEKHIQTQQTLSDRDGRHFVLTEAAMGPRVLDNAERMRVQKRDRR